VALRLRGIRGELWGWGWDNRASIVHESRHARKGSSNALARLGLGPFVRSAEVWMSGWDLLAEGL